MLAVCSRLFSVSLFEAPVKQNRLIKHERVSEAGSCAYANRLPSLEVYTRANKKQKTSICFSRAVQGLPFGASEVSQALEEGDVFLQC